MNFMTKKRTRSRTMTTIMCLTAGCGMAMSGSTAMAQSGYDDHMEHEPGEGIHEEEWYDPSDWWDDDFDGVRGPDVDYETDYDYGWNDDDWYDDGDNYAVYDGTQYEPIWWDESNYELYSDGYYNGYIDGYDDDEFGYDYQSASIGDTYDRYSTGYAAGYYDGYYDQIQDYDSDWTYYIYTVPADQQRERASRERSRDDSRERGDRAAEAGTHDMNRRSAQNDAKKRDTQRMRGTVTRVETLKDSKLRSKMKDHRVVRLTFEDGDQVVADLGKKADKGLIEKGDRVTVCGERISHDGRKMIDVSRLSVNDEIMWNARENNRPQQMSSR